MSKTLTYSSVTFNSDGTPMTDADRNSLNGDAMQRAIYDGTRAADPTAIRVTDNNLYRIDQATGAASAAQKNTSIQLLDRGNTVLMSNGSRVEPEVAKTLEAQSHLRIVHDDKPASTIKEEVEVEPTPEHAKDEYSKAVMADEATQGALGIFNNGLNLPARVAAIQEMTTTGTLSDNWYAQAAMQMNTDPAVVKHMIDTALTGLDRGYRALCERVGINADNASAYIQKHHGDTARSVAANVLRTGDLKAYGPLLRAAKAAGVK
jgi:hypothetical protein